MKIIFLGRIAQAIISLLALRVMTTLLPPEEVGRWSMLLAVTSFFVLGLVNPVGMFINRRLHQWIETGRVFGYFKYYTGYLLSVACVASIILLLGSDIYRPIPDMPILWLLLLVACSIVFSTLNQTFAPSLNLLEYRGWFVVLSIGTVAVSLFLSSGFVFLWGERAEVWQLGQIAGQLTFALFGGIIFFRVAKVLQKRKPDIKSMKLTKEKINTVFLFCWPLAIAVLLTWIQTQSYRFLIQDYVSLEKLGLFVVGYGVSTALIGMFESVFTAYFVPKFYQRVSSGEKSEYSLAWYEYAKAILLSLLITVAVIVSSSHELAVVLLASQFSDAAQYIVWGAIAEMARVIVGVYALLAHAHLDTRRLIVPNILAAISAPLLVILLTPSLGVTGLAIGLVFAGMIAVLGHHIFFSKVFSLLMPWKELLQSTIIAVVLISLLYGVHVLVGSRLSLLSSLVYLMVSGIVLLCTLYVMLRIKLQEERLN